MGRWGNKLPHLLDEDYLTLPSNDLVPGVTSASGEPFPSAPCPPACERTDMRRHGRLAAEFLTPVLPLRPGTCDRVATPTSCSARAPTNPLLRPRAAVRLRSS